MGINGLLQVLKFCTDSKRNIRDFAGQSVAVDASCWLHRAVYSIADHYVEQMEQHGNGGAADAHSIAVASQYVIKRCQELLTFAKLSAIYLVMDGKRCPLKAGTNLERDKRRQEFLELARKHRKEYIKMRDNASKVLYEKYYKACIKVSQSLAQAVARAVVQEFQTNNTCNRTGSNVPAGVHVIWAPFEADAQLAKLCVDGITQAVITEDSDVLVYAATCGVSFPILFKLDRHSGQCQVVSTDWLFHMSASNAACNHNGNGTTHNQKHFQSETTTTATANKKPAATTATTGVESILSSFALREANTPGLGVRLFVQACVLSGCDYAPNELNGVGCVTAFKHIKNAIHRDSADRFRYVLAHMKHKNRNQIDSVQYEEILAKSEAVFYYHTVLDKHGRAVKLCHVPNQMDPPDDRPRLDRFGEDLSFLGDVNIQQQHNKLCHERTLTAETCAKYLLVRPAPANNHSAGRNMSHQLDAGAVVAKSNPYSELRNKRRRSSPAVHRPLQSINTNLPRTNPFFKFKCSGKENPTFDYATLSATASLHKTNFDSTKNSARLALQVQTPDSLDEPRSMLSIENAEECGRLSNDTSIPSETQSGQQHSPMRSQTVSKYFSDRKRRVSRRVTFSQENQLDGDDNVESPALQKTVAGLPFIDLTETFDTKPSQLTTSYIYDDFYSPKKGVEAAARDPGLINDDLIDESPEPISDADVSMSCVSQRSGTPAPQSTIGPAKTLRFRYDNSKRFRPKTLSHRQGLRRKSLKSTRTNNILSYFKFYDETYGKK